MKPKKQITVTPDSRLDEYRGIMPMARVLNVNVRNPDGGNVNMGVVFGMSNGFVGNEGFVSTTEASIVVEGQGSKGKGYIPWGKNNQLPNELVASIRRSPYAAPAMKFNADVAFANGPRPMYTWLDLSNPENPQKRQIPYHLAGEMLREKIRRVKTELSASEQGGGYIATDEDARIPDAGSARERLAELNAALESWQTTNGELKRFIENSALDELYVSLCSDFAWFSIAFPEFVFNRGRTGDKWTSRIAELRYRRAMSCRLEELDDFGRVNYIYHNNDWASPPINKSADSDGKTKAIPSCSAARAMRELYRLSAINKNTKDIKKRINSLLMPVVYPSVDKFYYPEASYTAMFRSHIFEYSMRLIRNKAIAADNDNVWGYVVYIDESYIKKLYANRGAKTPEEQSAVEDELFGEIEHFLSEDCNKGKPLLAFSMRSDDGKTALPSIKIERVEQTKGSSETKEELEEIASILFFCMEMHPSIAGATPGKSRSAGGTETRELFLLKNVRMAPVRHLLLSPLRIVSAFNKWDEHLEWEMPYPVLTTLDANKKGITDKTE
ncbi:MAG: hypothetical protein RR346_03875 [Bacteroidales bacterium]